MTSPLASLPSVQISTVTRSGGPAPFCCNDPGCSCQGGKEAKAALDLRRQQENLDAVSISAQALQLLAGDRAVEVGASLTAQAVSPASASLAATFSSSAFKNATLAPPSTAESPTTQGASDIAGTVPSAANPAATSVDTAGSPAAQNDSSRLSAYRSIQQLAEAEKPPPAASRVDTYA